MFNWLRKSGDSKLSIELVKAIFNNLPSDYDRIKNQIVDGLIIGVVSSSSPIPNYTGFNYNPLISKRFEQRGEGFFKLKGIWALDKLTRKKYEIEVFITDSLIMGYSVPMSNRFSFDISTIDTSNFKKFNLDNSEFKRLQKILSESDLKLLNPNEVYELDLVGKTFFHIRDLEDGDFIGVDLKGKIFRITHDPFEIVELNQSLRDVLDDRN